MALTGARRLKKTRRTGMDPFAYMGVDAISPLRTVTLDRAPTSGSTPNEGDYRRFDVGDFWIDRSTLPDETVWFLGKRLAGFATWLEFATTSDLALQFDADVGSAVPTLAGVLNVPGSGVLTTTGSGNTLTYNITNGTDGQVLISDTGGVPAWANITSTGATIVVTNGANSINLETTVTSGFDTLSADLGIATPIAGNINILGDANITTAGDNASTLEIDLNDSIVINSITLSALGAGVMQTDNTGVVDSNNGTNGQLLIGGGTEPNWANITSAGGTITVTNGANTINLESAIAVGFDTITGDSGTATPAAGNIVIAGGTNITTIGDGASTLTVDLDDSIDIAGTLTLSALGAGVMQTDATGLVTSNNGANGEVLIGGGTAPAWDTITSTGGTITVSNGANTVNLEYAGGGLGTNAFLAFQPSQYIVTTPSYTLGESVILTEVYDTGNDFYPGDGAGAAATYTAPADGKYFFGYNHISHWTTPPVPPPPPPIIDPPVFHSIETTNFRFDQYGWHLLTIHHLSARFLSVLTEMDMGDTCEFVSKIGYADAEVDGHATEVRTFVCGYQVV